MNNIAPSAADAAADVSVSAPPSHGTWRDLFVTVEAAERYLAERGFSVGRRQGPSERGILLGDYDIQKWRNLRPADRAALHGVLTSAGRNSPAVVTIFGAAPVAAHEAIRKATDGAATRTGGEG